MAPPFLSSSTTTMAAPASSRLSKAERSSLKALVNAILPPQPVPDNVVGDGSRHQQRNKGTSASSAINQRYWEYNLSQDTAYLQALETTILQKLPDNDQRVIRLLLWLLSTPIGTCLLLLGTTSMKPTLTTLQPFTKWSQVQQTAALQSMQYSSLLIKRQIFQCTKRLICGIAFSYTIAGHNPFWDAIGYPGPPQLHDTHPNNKLQAITATEDTKRTLDAMGKQVTVQHAIIKHNTVSDDDKLECDVLIIGSGAGGCVAASVLSRAGYKVLVVDKGPYVSPVDTTNLESDAYDKMYESHGLLTTSDKSIMILAGATIGGGTTINWSCSLPLPKYVREEWATTYGLEAFRSGSEYEKALNYVLIKIGALDKSNIKHNPMNMKLQQGCNGMGYEWETTGQNLKNTIDPTIGYVCFGDRYGVKNNGVSVFLRDAVKHGAQIIDRCRVSQINQQDEKSGDTYTRTATGADCILTTSDKKFQIKAKKAVVVAAGALHTPCILQKSGLHNKHIGRHLRLHPVTAVMGFCNKDKEQPIDCFLGAPMTTVCNEFEYGPYQNGYGAKIECPSAHPGLLAASVPWTSPYGLKDRMQRLRSGIPLIVLQRDSGDGGSVWLSSDGKTPVVNYKLQGDDKKSMGRAVLGSLQILISAGAQTVQTSHVRDTGLTLGINLQKNKKGLLRLAGDEQITNYLSFIKQQGMKRHQVGMFSAHQMGSCRMSTTPDSGAVDVNGETWDCNNLFVMDASTFPTASGVNPMVTVFVIAKMLSTRLALRLRYEDQRPTGMAETVRAQEFMSKRKAMRASAQRSTFARIRRRTESSISSFTRSPVLRALLLISLLLLFGFVVFGFIFGGSMRQSPAPPPVEVPASSPMSSFLSAATGSTPRPKPMPQKPTKRMANSNKPQPAARTPKQKPQPPKQKPKPQPKATRKSSSQPQSPTQPPSTTTPMSTFSYDETIESLKEWYENVNTSNVLPYSIMWTVVFLPILGYARQ